MATCTVANLVSTTTSPFATLNARRRKAILLYMLAAEVAAAGGTDYIANPQQLFADAAAWAAMRDDQRDAAMIQVASESATAAGATIPADINDIVADTPQFEEYHDQALLELFLRCAVG